MLAEHLDRPLPKPRRDPVGYAAARALEALLEAVLALVFLEKGFTRNAAGKAFQAWKALTATLLVLERDRIAEGLRNEEQRRWLLESCIPRVPSSRLKHLSQLLEKAGINYYSFITDKALSLRDYQYHGPDPDLELSKYRSRSEAVYDIVALLAELARITEELVKPRLREANKWNKSHEEALQELREKLASR